MRRTAHELARQDPAKHLSLLTPLPRECKDCVTGGERLIAGRYGTGLEDARGAPYASHAILYSHHARPTLVIV